MQKLAEHEADIDFLCSAEGMLTCLLSEGELAAFERLVQAGIAYRSYEAGAGFMGMAKVRFRKINEI